MNHVLLIGRLTRDPEMRVLAGGQPVTTFSVATDDGDATEYHAIVCWDRLAESTGRWLSKGNLVSVSGKLKTRSWDDDGGQRHWRVEVVAVTVERLTKVATDVEDLWPDDSGPMEPGGTSVWTAGGPQ